MKLIRLVVVVGAFCCAPGGCQRSRDEVTVQVLSWEGTQALVASKKGKVVVLDLWSTTCVPCLREFPKLVELHEKLAADGLACISVSCDYIGFKDQPPESYREPVLAFLRKRGATFDNVLLNVPSDELFDALNLASIPAVYVYGRDGSLLRRFDNETSQYGEAGFNYRDHIVPLVKQALADGG